jgi:hypothetical protein
MIRKNLTLHNSNNSFTNSMDLSRRINIRRRLVQRQRIGQSLENNNTVYIWIVIFPEIQILIS